MEEDGRRSLAHTQTDIENTAPRIKSSFKPADEDLIQGQKNKQWRRERRIKRFLASGVGYAVMGWMIYLIVVTQRVMPKIWDPYTILGISRVGVAIFEEDSFLTRNTVDIGEGNQEAIPTAHASVPSRQGPAGRGTESDFG